jgi:hypothetical protein
MYEVRSSLEVRAGLRPRGWRARGAADRAALVLVVVVGLSVGGWVYPRIDSALTQAGHVVEYLGVVRSRPAHPLVGYVASQVAASEARR